MKRQVLRQLIICSILICISGGLLCAQNDDKPQMKELTEYQFQFNWLPLVAESYDVDEYKKLADLELMVDFLPQYNDYKAPYTSADIKAVIVPVGDLHAVVYEYSEPKEIPLCVYEVFMPVDGQFKIFTLEKSLENEWVLGWQGTEDAW